MVHLAGAGRQRNPGGNCPALTALRLWGRVVGGYAMFGKVIFEFDDGFLEFDLPDLAPLGFALLAVAVALTVVLVVRHWSRRKNRRDG
jgi:hypothetical protein